MNETIEWKTHEHEHYERGVDWYWGVGLVALAGAALAIFFGNLLLGILIIVSSAALAIQAATMPKFLTFELTSSGVRIEGREYPYESLESFWVNTSGHERKILLKSRRTLMPLIVIPLGEEVDGEKVRVFIGQYLPQEELHEPALQRVMEILGF